MTDSYISQTSLGSTLGCKSPCVAQCSREGKGQGSEAPRPGCESGLCCLLLYIYGAGGLIPALLGVQVGGGGCREGERGNPWGCPAHSLGSQLSLEALHRCCLLHLHSPLNQPCPSPLCPLGLSLKLPHRAYACLGGFYPQFRQVPARKGQNEKPGNAALSPGSSCGRSGMDGRRGV